MGIADYKKLEENELVRRYFRKFDSLIPILSSISEEENSSKEAEVIKRNLLYLDNTFEALSIKYLFSDKNDTLEIDTTDSGFPISTEIRKMEADIDLAKKNSPKLSSIAKQKEEILDWVLKKRTIPRVLQSQLAKKIYYEMLLKGHLFMIRNTIDIVDILSNKDRLYRYWITWSVYDTNKNLPIIYFLTAESPVAVDKEALKKSLYANSLSTLKLVTIATTLDREFSLFFPKKLKRIYIGPMYSGKFTTHTDSIQKILDYVPDGKDWVFSWTVEELLSQGQETIKGGFFSSNSVREIYLVDKHDAGAWSSGATSTEQHMVLPYEAYQALLEDSSNPLNGVYKYVVSSDNTILSNI